MDYETEYNDLSEWLSRRHRDIYADYKMGRMEVWHIMNNIKLEYKVIIQCGQDSFYADSAEFFLDEHNIQWVKFVPRNGYHIGKEHMLRTHLIKVIRNDGQEANQAAA